MRDIVYLPDVTPERQPELRQIPASANVDHPLLHAALKRYEEARSAELSSRRDATAAAQALPEAEHADALALADAQAAGSKDPGDKHRQRALASIAEGRRQHAASKIALARAVEAVVVAFETHGADWSADLERERDELRAEAVVQLDAFEAVWRQLQRNASARAIARGGVTQNPAIFVQALRVPRVRDGGVIDVADVLTGLRDLAKPEAPREAERQAPIPVGA